MRHDVFSHASGNRALGSRVIRKGGVIIWDGRTFQDDRLINVVGDRVDITFIGDSQFADGPIKVSGLYGGSVVIEKSEEKKLLDKRSQDLQGALIAFDVTHYQITYFDQNENCRKKYLNGASWFTENEAIEEFERIRNRDYQQKSKGVFSGRIKYALEAVKNKKRLVVKRLNLFA